jgi:hypothetical protein
VTDLDTDIAGLIGFITRTTLHYSSPEGRIHVATVRRLQAELAAARGTLTDARALAEKIRSNSCVAGYDCGHAGIEKIAKQLLAQIDRALSPISQATEKT